MIPYDVQQALRDFPLALQAEEKLQNYAAEAKKGSYLGLMWTALNVAPPSDLTRADFALAIPRQILSSLIATLISFVRFISGAAFWEKSKENLGERAALWLRDLARVGIEPVALVAHEVAIMAGIISPPAGNTLRGRINLLDLPSRSTLTDVALCQFKLTEEEVRKCSEAKSFIVEHYGNEGLEKITQAYNRSMRDIETLLPLLGKDKIAPAEKESIQSLLDSCEEDAPSLEVDSPLLEKTLMAAIGQDNTKAMVTTCKALMQRKYTAYSFARLLLIAFTRTQDPALKQKVTLSPTDVTPDKFLFGPMKDPFTGQLMSSLLLQALNDHLEQLEGLVQFGHGDWLTPSLRGQAMTIAQKFFQELSNPVHYASCCLVDSQTDEEMAQRLLTLLSPDQIKQVLESIKDHSEDALVRKKVELLERASQA